MSSDFDGGYSYDHLLEDFDFDFAQNTDENLQMR
jgi:hypothetical protein